jgi:hypothetical protein
MNKEAQAEALEPFSSGIIGFSAAIPHNLSYKLIGSQRPSFIAAIRGRRFESFGQELKKGMRIVAGEHIVRSAHVSATPGRNSYH